MKNKSIAIIILACCALFAAAGCKKKTAGRSEITARSGGLGIVVIADGASFVNPQENGFTVKVIGHEIVIDREHVLVDKKEAAKVPAGAKTFEVNFMDGTLTIGADGAEILKVPLAK